MAGSPTLKSRAATCKLTISSIARAASLARKTVRKVLEDEDNYTVASREAVETVVRDEELRLIRTLSGAP